MAAGDDLGKAADGAQRGAQVMRNGVRKRFEFLVGSLELGGAFLNT